MVSERSGLAVPPPVHVLDCVGLSIGGPTPIDMTVSWWDPLWVEIDFPRVGFRSLGVRSNPVENLLLLFLELFFGQHTRILQCGQLLKQFDGGAVRIRWRRWGRIR